MQWEEGPFLSIPLCSTYSLHHLVSPPTCGGLTFPTRESPFALADESEMLAVVTLPGKALFLGLDGHLLIALDLSSILDESLDPDQSLELVACDSSQPSPDHLTLLATW